MAGFLAGAAPFGALLTSYGWGLVSDQIGRKTVIICSSIAVVSSLWQVDAAACTELPPVHAHT